MDNENKQPYISDASRPSAGRMYDYFIGGGHNFEIDRLAAEKILKIAPFVSKMSKLIRGFLRVSIKRMVTYKFDQFLDFASGLPTEDHIHQNTPEGSKIIYSDIDPITVDYSREIIGENENVNYEFCNASNPEVLLESEIIKNLFGENHKAAIGFNGVSYFLKDEELNHALNVLYDWADNGSILFISDVDGENINDEFRNLINMYLNMNQFIRIRTKEIFKEIIKPWKVMEPGLQSFENWIGLSHEISDKWKQALGSGGFFAGYLIK